MKRENVRHTSARHRMHRLRPGGGKLKGWINELASFTRVHTLNKVTLLNVCKCICMYVCVCEMQTKLHPSEREQIHTGP